MAAALGAGLVFNMAGSSAKLDQALDGSGDVEGAGPEAGVNVHQQGRVANIRDAAYIRQHIIQRVDAQVGHAQRAGRDTSAGQINGAVPGALCQQGVVRIDGAHNLQRVLLRQGEAKALSGGRCGVHFIFQGVFFGRHCCLTGPTVLRHIFAEERSVPVGAGRECPGWNRRCQWPRPAHRRHEKPAPRRC